MHCTGLLSHIDILHIGARSQSAEYARQVFVYQTRLGLIQEEAEESINELESNLNTTQLQIQMWESILHAAEGRSDQEDQ